MPLLFKFSWARPYSYIPLKSITLKHISTSFIRGNIIILFLVKMNPKILSSLVKRNFKFGQKRKIREGKMGKNERVQLGRRQELALTKEAH